MKIVKFVGAHSSPQAGKPIHVNPDAVGIIFEGPGRSMIDPSLRSTVAASRSL